MDRFVTLNVKIRDPHAKPGRNADEDKWLVKGQVLRVTAETDLTLYVVKNATDLPFPVPHRWTEPFTDPTPDVLDFFRGVSP